MPFLGNEPANTFVSIAKQTITGNGGTSYTLSYAVTNANEIDVFYNNIRQEPTVAYTASGTTITFTEAIASTDLVYILYNGQAISTISPPTGSVGVGQLNTTEVDARYVNVSGDTMTNGLTINENTFGCNVRLKNDGAGGQDWYLFSTMNAFGQGGGRLMAYNTGIGGSYQWGVDISGRVTAPNQPFFTARQPANQTSTGGTGYYFHNYSDVIQNVGGHFNTSTGRFTAPITGVYMFRAIAMGTDPAEGSPHCGFSINGNANTGGGSYASNAIWEHPSNSGHKTDTMHIIKLNANDNIRFIQLSSVTLTQLDRTFFMGYLLG
jgi:hypothetical protein